MKKMLFAVTCLMLTNLVFAGAVEKCASAALAAPVREGHELLSGKYTTLTSGLRESDAMIIYLIPLAQKEGEGKKIAAVNSDLDCNVLAPIYYNVK